ncbi:MAG: MarR family winged helix-turn-helix transcriptional regulator [Pseudomonadota bacterium]
MNRDHTDRLLGSVGAVLDRFLVEGADGNPRPLRYNPVDYATLKRIEDTPDSRATDIAAQLLIPATTMQSALDRLVRMGFLEKRNHPTDGRAKVYRLSEEGVELRKQIHAQDRANMTAMLNVLPEEDREDFVAKMEVIEAALRR